MLNIGVSIDANQKRKCRIEDCEHPVRFLVQELQDNPFIG